VYSHWIVLSADSLRACPFGSRSSHRPRVHRPIYASQCPPRYSKIHTFYWMLGKQSAHRRPCSSGHVLSNIGREHSSRNLGNLLKLEAACGPVGEMHVAIKSPLRMYSKSRLEKRAKWKYASVKERDGWRKRWRWTEYHVTASARPQPLSFLWLEHPPSPQRQLPSPPIYLLPLKLASSPLSARLKPCCGHNADRPPSPADVINARPLGPCQPTSCTSHSTPRSDHISPNTHLL